MGTHSIKTVVVSLKNSVHRCRINDTILPVIERVSIVDAFDARQKSPAELKRYLDEKQIDQNMGRRLASAEIGCAISHLSLYRKMLLDNEQLLLVLEDDAVLETDITAKILEFFNSRNGLPTILSFFSGEAIVRNSDIDLHAEFSLCFLPPTHTVCYALNASAAKLITQTTDCKVTSTADWPPIPGLSFFIHRKQIVRHNILGSSIEQQRANLKGLTTFELFLKCLLFENRYYSLLKRNCYRWILKKLSKITYRVQIIRHKDGL